jgi:hypothetical protein
VLTKSGREMIDALIGGYPPDCVSGVA